MMQCAVLCCRQHRLPRFHSNSRYCCCHSIRHSHSHSHSSSSSQCRCRHSHSHSHSSGTCQYPAHRRLPHISVSMLAPCRACCLMAAIFLQQADFGTLGTAGGLACGCSCLGRAQCRSLGECSCRQARRRRLLAEHWHISIPTLSAQLQPSHSQQWLSQQHQGLGIQLQQCQQWRLHRQQQSPASKTSSQPSA